MLVVEKQGDFQCEELEYVNLATLWDHFDRHKSRLPSLPTRTNKHMHLLAVSTSSYVNIEMEAQTVYKDGCTEV